MMLLPIGNLSRHQQASMIKVQCVLKVLIKLVM